MPSDKNQLTKNLEAILFWKGEPQSIKELSKALNTDEDSIKSSVKELEEQLQGRGIILMQNNDEIMLGTSPDTSKLIEAITKEELSRDLGKAALETLAIILYKGPVKRSEVDYIRGVNSTFIIRNLLIRGLIEKKQAPDDQRASLYSTSFDLLSHLGISNVKELPEFDQVQQEIRKFKETHEESVQPTEQSQSKI
ncbi:MAG: SMC-Scp complex subunit ScpB [Patescibacteria group bacterium]